jgi:WD40 repeat protein
VGPFIGHTDSVFSAVFSQDGERIASASGDHTIRLWGCRKTGGPSGDIHRTYRKGQFDLLSRQMGGVLPQPLAITRFACGMPQQ